MMSALTPGFAQPAGDSQSCFRLVLDAMARPGLVHSVRGVEAPAPLCDAAAAVVLTLLDHETLLWLDPRANAAAGWIAFHTAAPVTDDPARAVFALALSFCDAGQPVATDAAHGPHAMTVLGDPASGLKMTAVPIGSGEAPETSATVILQVDSLTTGTDFVLEGPGLRQPATLTVDGLPAEFAAIWQRNHALFPRGIDLILCAGNRIAALPRSVAVREG